MRKKNQFLMFTKYVITFLLSGILDIQMYYASVIIKNVLKRYILQKKTKNECMLSTTYCLKLKAAKFNGSNKVKLAESVACILESV